MEPLTLDQLRVFLAVADAGTFSAAAKRLGRTQSAVSYAVAHLERSLGVALFDRTGKQPTLTAAGQSLRGDAQSIANRVEDFLARARAIAAGTEPTLALAVDALFPMSVLREAVGRLREAFPAVSLVLHNESLGAVTQRVLDGAAQLGVGAPLPRFPEGLERDTLFSVALVHVVARSHPLASYTAPIPRAVLRDHVQLVVSDRSRLTEGVDLGVLSARTWRLADMGTKHEFLRAGFGWGSLPLHMVQQDLAEGRLVRIVTIEWGADAVRVPMLALSQSAAPPGPAGRWLVEQLRELGARAEAREQALLALPSESTTPAVAEATERARTVVSLAQPPRTNARGGARRAR